MQRLLVEVPQGQDLVRSIVRITDDPGEGDGFEGFMALGRFLQTIMAEPSILRHATDCPSEVSIRHDGKSWVLETISLTVRPPDGVRQAGAAPVP